MVRYTSGRIVRRDTFLVFKVDLSKNPLAEHSLPAQYRVKVITCAGRESEKLISFWLDQYVDYYPLYYYTRAVRRLITERLNAGELCFVAEVDGEIVHMNWISVYNSCAANKGEPFNYLPFRPGKQALSYNTYTHPDHRGKGIVQGVKAHILRYLSARGCEVMYSCIGIKNIASRRIHDRIGRHIYNLYVTRFLVFSRAYLRKAGTRPGRSRARVAN